MKLNVVLFTVLFLGPAALSAAEATPAGKMDASSAFARLKTLAGEWEADTSMGKARLSYEVIAGGATLVEREWFEKGATMMTIYHLDGERLLLTHYCMAGNQPRMQARSYNPASGELEFAFLDATNLKPGAGHMHSARLRFADDRQFQSEWTFHEGGRAKSTEKAVYTRVK